MASKPSTERFILYGLAATTFIFLILFIVFVSLYATKHDSSSSFLFTAVTTLTTKQLASNEVYGLLSSQYHVNSLSVDLNGNQLSAVFSLRGSQSADSVGKIFQGNSHFQGVEVTDGSNSNAVCSNPVWLPITTTSKPTTSTTTTTTSLMTTSSSPATTSSPVSSNLYCGKVTTRDVVIVFDAIPSQNPNAGKIASIEPMATSMSAKLSFPETRVALMAIDDQAVLFQSKFIDNAADFKTNWTQVVQVTTTASKDASPNFDLANQQLGILNFASSPLEIIYVFAHSLSESKTDMRTKGAFVSILQVGFSNPQFSKLSSAPSQFFESWSSFADGSPFSVPLCTYQSISGSTAFSTDFISMDAVKDEKLDKVVSKPSCEELDMLFVFDISSSIPPSQLQKYQQFAKQTAAKYTLTNSQTRLGVIEFNEIATTLLSLNTSQTTIATFNSAVDQVQHSTGTTNTTAAFQEAYNQFNNPLLPELDHGKVLVFMSDGEPNLNNLLGSQNLCEKMLGEGTAIYFIGTSQYSQSIRKDLTDLDGGFSDRVYDNTTAAAAAGSGMTDNILHIFPCSPQICSQVFFAVECSEDTFTSEPFFETALQVIRDVATNIHNANGSVFYQLVIYNSQTWDILQSGNFSYYALTAHIDQILQVDVKNNDWIAEHVLGDVRLDLAINHVRDLISQQLTNHPLMQAKVFFAGEANYWVLDPNYSAGHEQDKWDLLANAAQQLKAVAPDPIAFDKNNSAEMGEDLWNAVVDPSDLIEWDHTSDVLNAEVAIANTNFYKQVESFSCELPQLATCYYNQIDLAVALDVVDNTKLPNVTNYLTTFISQFATQYATHVTTMAFGSGLQAKTFLNLSAYETKEIKQGTIDGFNKWRTPTLEKFEEQITLATNATNVTSIDELFGLLKGQFGCSHYSPYQDRFSAPNIVLIVTDNLSEYNQAVWAEFSNQPMTTWACGDCQGIPQFYFMSLTNEVAPKPYSTFTVTDQLFDVKNDRPSINELNFMINTICNSPGQGCWSFSPQC